MSARSIPLLVVKDYKPWRDYLFSLLQTKPGFHVDSDVADELEAVQKPKELKPDLILLDIGLPALNGLEVAKRIRQIAPDAKLSSYNSDTDVVWAGLRAGAQGYGLKTDAVCELFTALKASLPAIYFVSAVEDLKSGKNRRCMMSISTLSEYAQDPRAVMLQPHRFLGAVVTRQAELQIP